ncbi:UDP-N-acetylglucosamine 1-carboxyvinyltransferase [Saccharophagus degradans]|uniref:UDP-N-acetylglucosamine 1-carboxyvinyltransferase n=1 Tax=Saccharophagus degradans TaxID=86304 RepID=A0AAW7X250_9GAMM|nr:UDP-N-acetylglucosamine 1-carboxyvinyltransferase [Saccharophagus degradans]MDO6421058.1 UDP-N-acetylglucosamine 1-carboxyvinyltransferase [Saccharophagus degradans]MDO6606031.1 UDP-N-acetylglucosamine 1-carboxyvinyltransferase [Saccharophagus degradans]
MKENLSAVLEVMPSRLSGCVELSGAKNSVLRLLAASILFDDVVRLNNYPSELLDVVVHEEMLKILGKKIEHVDGSVIISQSSNRGGSLIWEGRSIRNTLLILGALLTKTGFARVPLPGGCKLGDRKFDIHIDLIKALGGRVWEEDGYLVAEAEQGKLLGADVELRLRSTGGTENAILMGCLAEGVTRIFNPHIRPEIVDLVAFLNNAGAKINIRGQESIVIEGVPKLFGAIHNVMPDNMEALTWLVISSVTKSQIKIKNFPFEDLEVPLIFLRESGVNLYRCGSDVIVGEGECFPVELSTGPYPGINSDMQPIFAAFAAFANGKSHIVDLRFPGRYLYANEMRKMGVDSISDGDVLTISGGKPVYSGDVRALDLRAGIALLILALGAESGVTKIRDAWQIFRGYDRLIEKLTALGAKVRYVV